MNLSLDSGLWFCDLRKFLKLSEHSLFSSVEWEWWHTLPGLL